MSESNPEDVVPTEQNVNEVDDVQSDFGNDPEPEEVADDSEDDSENAEASDVEEDPEQERRRLAREDTDVQRDIHRDQAAAKATSDRQFNQPPAPEDSSDNDE